MKSRAAIPVSNSLKAKKNIQVPFIPTVTRTTITEEGELVAAGLVGGITSDWN